MSNSKPAVIVNPRPGAVTGDVPQLSQPEILDSNSGRPMTSKGALRQRRYRQKLASRDAASVTLETSPPASPEAAVTAALDALLDAIEHTTPQAVIDQADRIALLGLRSDALLAGTWLSCLEVLATAVLKRGAAR